MGVEPEFDSWLVITGKNSKEDQMRAPIGSFILRKEESRRQTGHGGQYLTLLSVDFSNIIDDPSKI